MTKRSRQALISLVIAVSAGLSPTLAVQAQFQAVKSSYSFAPSSFSVSSLSAPLTATVSSYTPVTSPAPTSVLVITPPPPTTPPVTTMGTNVTTPPITTLGATITSMPVTTVSTQQNNPPARVTTTGYNPPSVRVFTTGVATDTARLGVAASSEIPEITAEPGYQFAFASCQGVTGKNKGYVVFPVRGSLYSFDNDSNIKLAQGRMLVIADKEPVNVSAGNLKLVVNSGSSALVASRSADDSRIYVLSSSSTSAPGASVSLAGSSPQSVSLQTGQALIVASHDIQDEELISIDGIEHKPIEGGIAAQLPKTVALANFSLDQMRNQNLLIACRPLDVHRSNKKSQMLKNIHEQVAEAAKQQKGIFSGIATTPTVPTMAAATSILVSTNGNQKSQDNHEMVIANNDRLIIARKSSVYKQDGPDHMVLELGSILVRSNKEMHIKAADQDVLVSKGAVALVSSNSISVKVICVSEKANKSVIVVSQNKVANLLSGQELLLSKKAPALADLYDIHNIGHRNIVSEDLSGSGWVTTSEIYLVDALANHPLLKAIRQHGQNDMARKVINEITTTAAALSILGRNAGTYTQGQPEDESGLTAVVASRCASCGQ